MAGPGKDPDPFHHVTDDPSGAWHFFDRLFGRPVEFHLPEINLGFYKFQVTKFMVLELIAAIIILLIFIPLARRARDGSLPRGPWWNCFESLLTFIRNEVAKPNLHHDADKFTPYLWTVFLFVLVCNLLGMIPFMGSPTASIAVTGALGLCSLVLFHGAGIIKMGPLHYFKSLWPHIEVPYAGAIFSAMIFVIEFLGSFIKSGVLAVRLFANLFAGHMVLAFILTFIYMAGKGGFTALWPVVTVTSVLGIVALSLLEIFVAFLQAYVFTFLTALFLGMSLHPQH